MYIGETGRTLLQRFYEHHQDARNEDLKKPCGIHFSGPGHSEADMTVIALEQVLPKHDVMLKKDRKHFG